jgi:CcmD family protein
MQKIRTLLTFLTLLMITMCVRAQEGTAKTTIGETMRSQGRIYVVVAVMLTILIGLILYLVRLDRKIGKVEKEHLS